jgi:RimJ/RimL family protein N-acetyltransferase
VALTIRGAVPGDARAIAEVHVASWEWAYRGSFPDATLDRVSVDDRERMWGAWFAEPEERGGLLVVERDGRVVGFCGFGASHDDDADEDTGEIRTIYLLQEAAGRGIGRALFALANERLRDVGYRRATLWTLESNARSRRFYEAAGWRQDGASSEHRFEPGVLPVVRYVAEL